ncbi:MAG: hypothetical protein E6Q90_02875 [Actinobacteria bacterium]|nr:MAG: hypothetical protein E6Q90_02875 [Actinomycetota bacterium]
MASAESATVVGGSGSQPGAAPVGAKPNQDRKVLLIAGGAVAAVVLVGGAIFVAMGLGGGSTNEVSAATSPSVAQPTPAATVTASPAPVTTVTATAVATVTATTMVAQPEPTYPVSINTPPPTTYAPTFSGSNFGFDWRGSVAGSENGKTVMYDSQLSLSQDSSGYVTGKASLASSSGNAGVYTVSGQVRGNRLELTPGSWINKPNSTWAMDAISLTKNGSTVYASYTDPRDPGDPWGSATLS